MLYLIPGVFIFHLCTVIVMHLVYKMLVPCLPESHLNKLLFLVRNCFPYAYDLSIHDLRAFNYAIVAQQEGQFVGVLFVQTQIRHPDPADYTPPETEHNIHYLCVLERFRRDNIASELLQCCKTDSAADTEPGTIARLRVSFPARLFLTDDTRQRLIAFFERHDFSIQGEIEGGGVHMLML